MIIKITAGFVNWLLLNKNGQIGSKHQTWEEGTLPVIMALLGPKNISSAFFSLHHSSSTCVLRAEWEPEPASLSMPLTNPWPQRKEYDLWRPVPSSGLCSPTSAWSPVPEANVQGKYRGNIWLVGVARDCTSNLLCRSLFYSSTMGWVFQWAQLWVKHQERSCVLLKLRA